MTAFWTALSTYILIATRPHTYGGPPSRPGAMRHAFARRRPRGRAAPLSYLPAAFRLLASAGFLSTAPSAPSSTVLLPLHKTHCYFQAKTPPSPPTSRCFGAGVHGGRSLLRPYPRPRGAFRPHVFPSRLRLPTSRTVGQSETTPRLR